MKSLILKKKLVVKTMNNYKEYMKVKMPTCKGRTIEENNSKSLADMLLDFYVSNVSSNYVALCRLYDYLLICKLTANSDSAMDAYQKVIDYLKENFLEVALYAE